MQFKFLSKQKIVRNVELVDIFNLRLFISGMAFPFTMQIYPIKSHKLRKCFYIRCYFLICSHAKIVGYLLLSTNKLKLIIAYLYHYSPNSDNMSIALLKIFKTLFMTITFSHCLQEQIHMICWILIDNLW